MRYTYSYQTLYVALGLVLCFVLEKISNLLSFLCLFLAGLVFFLFRIPYRVKLSKGIIRAPISGIVTGCEDDGDNILIHIKSLPLFHSQGMSFCTENGIFDRKSSSVSYSKEGIKVMHQAAGQIYLNPKNTNCYSVGVGGCLTTIIAKKKKWSPCVVVGQSSVGGETEIVEAV